ncbi:hypothetical protein DID88_007903 [Monilinia fructigena]|uniref:Uncharacterized protein n=1 Tax=Monilinia fructigena TaxID=38457 RepID=A0A395J3M8_9HELO|nr:hypothetical protein DID88_007903 [Monilinia fructigena]
MSDKHKPTEHGGLKEDSTPDKSVGTSQFAQGGVDPVNSHTEKLIQSRLTRREDKYHKSLQDFKLVWGLDDIEQYSLCLSDSAAVYRAH